MIRYARLPENIEALLPGAGEYLRSRKDVLFACLFGGIAKGKRGPLSDADIAVCLSEDADIARAWPEILGDLSDILHTDEIDLVILNRAPLSLKMRILADRKVIADNAPFARHAYESLTMRTWFDFSVLERNILERRFLRG